MSEGPSTQRLRAEPLSLAHLMTVDAALVILPQQRDVFVHTGTN
jgi:hypothetical protein